MRAHQVISGIHAVLSALRNDPGNVQELRVDRGRQDARLNELRRLAQTLNIPLREVDAETLERQARTRHHQGVAALYRSAPTLDEPVLTALIERTECPLLLVLDCVTDPHNLGACLRTAEAAGATAVITPRDRSASINATVRKIASGAAERLPVAQVTNLARCLLDLKQRGVWLVGADGSAAQSLFDLDLNRPLALLMGAEDKGLRRLTREHCDYLARIPMADATQSLNVSVAAGVCLFEARRQRLARNAAASPQTADQPD
jgi:predicted rRNA methylase